MPYPPLGFLKGRAKATPILSGSRLEAQDSSEHDSSMAVTVRPSSILEESLSSAVAVNPARDAL